MFRNFAGQTTSWRMNFGSVAPRLQLGLALGAFVCGWIALRNGLDMQVAASGLCLGAAKGGWLADSGHCPWCYSALALMALAAWPVGAKDRFRAHG